MTPTPSAVPNLFPSAPQREAGLDLHAIAGPSIHHALAALVPRCPASHEERTAWRDDARACPDARPLRGTRVDHDPLHSSQLPPAHYLACPPAGPCGG